MADRESTHELELPHHSVDPDDKDVNSVAGEQQAPPGLRNRQTPSSSTPRTIPSTIAALSRRTGIEADDEKNQRRWQYRDEYAAFQSAANFHRMCAEHLASRRMIFLNHRERNEWKMAEYESEIARMRVENERAEGAEAELIAELGKDADLWEEDRQTQQKWDAYFDLETEELGI